MGLKDEGSDENHNINMLLYWSKSTVNAVMHVYVPEKIYLISLGIQLPIFMMKPW